VIAVTHIAVSNAAKRRGVGSGERQTGDINEVTKGGWIIETASGSIGCDATEWPGRLI
jgi:hypothetical protein